MQAEDFGLTLADRSNPEAGWKHIEPTKASAFDKAMIGKPITMPVDHAQRHSPRSGQFRRIAH